MIRRYYKLEGVPAASLLKQYQGLTELLVKKRSDIILSFKAYFGMKGELMMGIKPLGKQVAIGLTCRIGELSPSWGYLKEIEGSNTLYIEPNLVHNRGRVYQDFLNKINDIDIPTFSSFVVDKILGDQKLMIVDGMSHYAVAGLHDGVLVLSVPTKKGIQMNLDYDYTVGGEKYGVHFETIQEQEYRNIVGEQV